MSEPADKIGRWEAKMEYAKAETYGNIGELIDKKMGIKVGPEGSSPDPDIFKLGIELGLRRHSMSPTLFSLRALAAASHSPHSLCRPSA